MGRQSLNMDCCPICLDPHYAPVNKNSRNIPHNNNTPPTTNIDIEASALALHSKETKKEEVRTACRHQFHKHCLLMWFVSSANMECPMCRTKCDPLQMTPPIVISDFFSLRESDSSYLQDDQFLIHLRYLSCHYFGTDISYKPREMTFKDMLEITIIFFASLAIFAILAILLSFQKNL
jgi:hypothetical protein